MNNKFKKITEKNFHTSYNDFKILTLQYRQYFSKPEILEFLFNYNKKNNLDKYQEEVLTEIENCIFGYCSPSNVIKWKY